jgi:hypothetical protein
MILIPPRDLLQLHSVVTSQRIIALVQLFRTAVVARDARLRKSVVTELAELGILSADLVAPPKNNEVPK